MITTISPVYDLEARAAYLCVGVGAKREVHRTAGSDRLMPGSYVDGSDMDEFVRAGTAVAEKHGRRVMAQSLVVSFSPDELDKASVDDQRLVGGLAHEVATRAFPGAKVAIVVHADGGAPHAHVLVINDQDGRAIRKNRTHWQLKRIADEVAAEAGLSVIAEPRPREEAKAWPDRQNEASAFERKLGASIAAALSDPTTSTWERFIASCAARGVTVELRPAAQKNRRGQATPGLTFKMLDDTGSGRPRIRRRKASGLSSSFTYLAISKVLESRRTADHAAPQTHIDQRKGVAGGRGDLVSALAGVVAAGLFGGPGLDGFALAALRAGVRVARSRRREGLTFGFVDSDRRWHETELPSFCAERRVVSRIDEVERIRAIAPAGTDHLPIDEVVKLIDSDFADSIRRNVRRRPRADLPPAAARAAERAQLKGSPPHRLPSL